MSEQPEETTTSPTAVERAEQFWSDVGRSLQTVVQRARQQTQQTTTVLQKKLNETTQSSPEAQKQEPAQPPMEKADQLVHSMEQRLAQWISTANLQMRRTSARMREEAEDILAEAHNLRQRNAPPS